MKKIFLLMIAGVVISLPIQGEEGKIPVLRSVTAKRKTVPESAQWQGQGERKEQLARDRAERKKAEAARRAARRKREALLLKRASKGHF
jgi:hypothetical protein